MDQILGWRKWLHLHGLRCRHAELHQIRHFSLIPEMIFFLAGRCFHKPAGMLCEDASQTYLHICALSVRGGRLNLITWGCQGLAVGRTWPVACKERFGRFLCKISSCGQQCNEGICGVKEGGGTNSDSLGVVSRSRDDSELSPSLGSVEQCVSSAPWEAGLLTNTRGLILHRLCILCTFIPGLQYQSA